MPLGQGLVELQVGLAFGVQLMGSLGGQLVLVCSFFFCFFA